ncbi:NAD(P)/FAD-dependent oxidoreductase [Telmatospirillum siberiense]|uniref:NAD(P)/FAD-dependent oxidoreductase n=1 Tax=Telmatospirillum siberiense TaxID=382514 RepID=UPI0018EB41E4|nr:FAD-dependent oxidoreductase [Telmatospirillum siberiense]
MLVVGAGLIGASIAYGLARQGVNVCVLDEGDVALRASRGNFGLIWVQGKGLGAPAYARWTRRSAGLWRQFLTDLTDISGIAVPFEQRGGVELCQTEQELANRLNQMEQLSAEARDLGFAYERLDAEGLRRHFPGIAADVAGGVFTPYDGHVDPLRLLSALHTALARLGVPVRSHAGVVGLRALDHGGYVAETSSGGVEAAQLVLAAGLGTRSVAEQLGVAVPLHPIRGQVLITERLAPAFGLPTSIVRQTADGTVQIGSSQEDVGFDTGTRPEVLAAIARKAIRFFPFLKKVQVVRAWGALRIMSPDGLPIYDSPADHPGCFIISCHSGVTLSPVHALVLAPAIAGGLLPDGLRTFQLERFHVSPPV